jgi:hypothetical protein
MKVSKSIFSLNMVLLVLCLVVFASCDCEDITNPDCSNYDPCYEKFETDASFTMYESLLNPERERIFIPSDTILEGEWPLFTSNFPLEEHQWMIGTDTVPRTGDSIRMYFVDPHGTIDVEHTGRQSVNPLCFPDDDGIDVKRRQLTILPWHETAILGKYHGYIEQNPTDTFTITIEKRPERYIINLVRECPGYEFKLGSNGYRSFGGTQPIRCPDNNTVSVDMGDVSGVLSPDHKTLTIDFRTSNHTPIDRRFIGRKIF